MAAGDGAGGHHHLLVAGPEQRLAQVMRRVLVLDQAQERRAGYQQVVVATGPVAGCHLVDYV